MGGGQPRGFGLDLESANCVLPQSEELVPAIPVALPVWCGLGDLDGEFIQPDHRGKPVTRSTHLAPTMSPASLFPTPRRRQEETWLKRFSIRFGVVERVEFIVLVLRAVRAVRGGLAQELARLCCRMESALNPLCVPRGVIDVTRGLASGPFVGRAHGLFHVDVTLAWP